ncbi:MAG: hypothetical protein NZ749_05170 [bacterium]|nr:hypothetical protein [bacterium]
MWIVGILCVLAGAEMVLRAKESYFASALLQQYRQVHERFFDSDMMMDFAFLLSVLLPWLAVWGAAPEWVSVAVRSVVCIAGCMGALYVWYKTKHRVRASHRRFMELLCAGRFNQWIGVGYILMGVLVIAFDFIARSLVPLSNQR